MDGQTYRWTEFSSLDRVCIPCSTVITYGTLCLCYLSGWPWSRDVAGATVSRVARYGHYGCLPITRWKDAIRRHVIRRCTLLALPARDAWRMVRVSRPRLSHHQGNWHDRRFAEPNLNMCQEERENGVLSHNVLRNYSLIISHVPIG